MNLLENFHIAFTIQLGFIIYIFSSAQVKFMVSELTILLIAANGMAKRLMPIVIFYFFNLNYLKLNI